MFFSSCVKCFNEHHVCYLREFVGANYRHPGLRRVCKGGSGQAVASPVSPEKLEKPEKPEMLEKPREFPQATDEFREGTDDGENAMHRAIFPGKWLWITKNLSVFHYKAVLRNKN